MIAVQARQRRGASLLWVADNREHAQASIRLRWALGTAKPASCWQVSLWFKLQVG